MVVIDASLDDLQSGIEASSRIADMLHSDASEFAHALKQIRNAPVIESLVRRAAELQVSARDQRAVILELREAIAELLEALKFSRGAVKTSPQASADRTFATLTYRKARKRIHFTHHPMAHLFDPLSIRDLTFANRVFVSPMCEYLEP